MGTRFAGHCTGKSMFNGQPTGTDFTAEVVFFEPHFFAGQKKSGQEFVQIYYGKALEPRTEPYVLPVKNDGSAESQLEYKVRDRTFRTEGTLTVTISDTAQKGTLDGTYFDEQGRLLKFEVDFEANQET